MIETDVAYEYYEETPRRRGLTQLRWFDVLVITVILFGSAILDSTMTFLSFGSEAVTGALTQTLDEAMEVLPVFTPFDDLYAIIQEVCLLSAAFVYLKLRHFDFSVWKVKASMKGTGWGILLFFVTGLLFDILSIVVYGWSDFSRMLGYHELLPILMESTLVLFVFSLLNGFFEEIFFLGVCTAVNPKYRWAYLLYSLVVRFSFHTYQGLVSSIGIGLILGILYYVLFMRSRDRNLYPFFIAHAGADLIGLTFLPLL